MTESFGPTDATSENTKQQHGGREAKIGNPVATRNPEPAKREVYIVDEERDVAVTALYSTVVFHPGERLTDKRLIELAKEHNIALRKKK